MNTEKVKLIQKIKNRNEGLSYRQAGVDIASLDEDHDFRVVAAEKRYTAGISASVEFSCPKEQRGDLEAQAVHIIATSLLGDIIDELAHLRFKLYQEGSAHEPLVRNLIERMTP